MSSTEPRLDEYELRARLRPVLRCQIRESQAAEIGKRYRRLLKLN